MYSRDLQRVTIQPLSHASRNRTLTTFLLKLKLGWLRRNLSSVRSKDLYDPEAFTQELLGPP